MQRDETAWRVARISPVTRALVAGMLFFAVPGISELVEDAAHVLVDGHTAHDAGHEGEQPGHCCSGLFHACACHVHVDGSVVGRIAVLPALAHASLARRFGRDAFRPGFHVTLLRPPRALVRAS